MTVATNDTRFCEKCVSVKPLTEFRRRSQNGPHRLNQCRECHNRAERERRAWKRAQGDHRRMGKCLTELMNAPNNDRLELLFGVMLQQFGGMAGFVAAWADYQRRAEGFAAFRCFKTVLRLMQYCEENQPDPSEMTDEELHQSLMENTKAIIQLHPELVVAAANEIGWTVIPHCVEADA